MEWEKAMKKEWKFFKLIFYTLTAIISSFSLLLISLGAWLLFMLTNVLSVIVILAMLFGFGFGIYYIKNTCCHKWSVNSKFFLLAAFLPSFIISASYLAQVAYSYYMRYNEPFDIGSLAAYTIHWSFAISYFGASVIVFLSSIIFEAIAKKGGSKTEG